MNLAKKKSFIIWFFKSLFGVLFFSNSFVYSVDLNKVSFRILWFSIICLAFGLTVDAIEHVLLSFFCIDAFKKYPELLNRLAYFTGQNAFSFQENFTSYLEELRAEKLIVAMLSPLISFFFISLFSGLLYFVIKSVFAKNLKTLTYEKTLNIVAFSQAPMVFLCVPVIGHFISAFWMFFIIIRFLNKNYVFNTFYFVLFLIGSVLFLKFLWSFLLRMLAVLLLKIASIPY